MHSLLFKVADKSVTFGRGQHIGEEVGIEEEALGHGNRQPEEYSRVSQFEEEEEVHALVLCLLKQMMNPAVITFECPKTSQMSLHATDHAWDTSDCFKENHTS